MIESLLSESNAICLQYSEHNENLWHVYIYSFSIQNTMTTYNREYTNNSNNYNNESNNSCWW